MEIMDGEIQLFKITAPPAIPDWWMAGGLEHQIIFFHGLGHGD